MGKITDRKEKMVNQLTTYLVKFCRKVSGSKDIYHFPDIDYLDSNVSSDGKYISISYQSQSVLAEAN